MNLRLSDVATWTGGKILGTDVALSGLSADTRTIKPGDLFVELVGEHQFVRMERAA